MASQGLQAALSVYFEAKRLMYRNIPEFQCIQTGLLKCLHKHPGWPEVDAFYAVDVEPSEAIAAIAKYIPHRRHMLTVFMHAPPTMDQAFAALGYHPLPGGQPLMRLELSAQTIARVSSVVHVKTPEQVDFMNLPGAYMDAVHLNDGVFCYYYIEQDGLPVCRGRSVTTTQHAIYVAGIDTLPAYRRHGLASTLSVSSVEGGGDKYDAIHSSGLKYAGCATAKRNQYGGSAGPS